MPLYVPVVDAERPRSERDDESEEMRAHRAFDNPHQLHPSGKWYTHTHTHTHIHTHTHVCARTFAHVVLSVSNNTHCPSANPHHLHQGRVALLTRAAAAVAVRVVVAAGRTRSSDARWIHGHLSPSLITEGLSTHRA